ELHRQRLARRVAFLLGREPRLPPSGQRGFPAALRRPRLATRDRLPPAEGLTMKEPTVVRLAQTERVSFGPLSHYQLIIGDDEGSTPVRTGIQTAQPATRRLCTRIPTSRSSTSWTAPPRRGSRAARTSRSCSSRATRSRFRPTPRTASASEAIGCSGSWALTPRPDVSSPTRTAPRATRAATASSTDRGPGHEGAMIATADAVVVGSGAFGASAAYHLARRGVRVAVLERSGLASQTSPRAAGLSSQVRATPQLTKLAQRAVAK